MHDPRATGDFMWTTIHVALRRLPRNRCGVCKRRRVLFVRTINGSPSGLSFCATCAGFGVERHAN